MKLSIITSFLFLHFIHTYHSAAQPNVINTSSYDATELIKEVCSILNIDKVIIFVKDMPKQPVVTKTNSYNIRVRGCVIAEGYNAYTIYLGRSISMQKFNASVIEEVCHIYQYHNDLLYRIDRYNVKYMNKKINLYRTPYNRRMYEVDAKVMTKKIMRKLCFEKPNIFIDPLPEVENLKWHL